MGKEADKFIKDFKATKAKLKELSPQAAEKMKKDVIAQLDKTWAAEDQMKEGVIKAREDGVQGKKSGDFVKHGKVAKPFKTWKSELDLHHKRLDAFDKFRAEARSLEQALTKRIAVVEKELKKSGGLSDVKAAAVLQEAKRALPTLKKAAGVFGTMQGHVVMYAQNVQRATDAIVQQAVESVEPKKLPDAFAQEGRAKTEKQVQKFQRQIDGILEIGERMLEEGQAAKATVVVKKAQPLLKKIKALNKEAQATAKKMKKEIKQAKDGKEVTRLIKSIDEVYSQAVEMVEDLANKIKEANSRRA